MVHHPFVSILMPAYNAEKTLAKCLESILKQNYSDFEVVIINDGSKDRTLEIAEKFSKKEQRINVYSQENKGGNAARNKALEIAKGEFIFLSDQDDIWVEKKVEIMKKYLKEYDFVISDAIITDEFLNVIGESLYKTVNSRKGIIKNIYKNTYYGCCMALKRDILLKAFPFPKNKEIGHDLWLGLIAEKYGKIKFINNKLIYFRRHQSNVTSINKSKRNFFKKAIGRIIILYHYVKIGKKNI